MSKPGIDVTTASPGQFLLDTSSQVYQRVASGSTLVVTNPNVGAYTATVSLGGAFTPYSNLAVLAALQMIRSGATNYDPIWTGTFTLRQHVTAGALYLTVDSRADYTPVSPAAQFWANWCVFRGQY